MQLHTPSILLVLAVTLPACVDSPPTPTPTPDASRQIAVEGAPELDGWALWNPDERVNDPRAGDPYYVYLVIGADAVLLPGPTVTIDAAAAAAVFGDGTATTSWEVTSEGYAGLTVVVADVLTYQFDIQDFENEISPVRIDLELIEGQVHSRFVFAADGDEGVAHQAYVHATIADVTSDATGPWTIEARSF